MKPDCGPQRAKEATFKLTSDKRGLIYDKQYLHIQYSHNDRACSHLKDGTCLLIQTCFCKGYDYGGKRTSYQGSLESKTKNVGNTHFSEIIYQR